MPDFIAFDWCGWDDRYGRFTHCPSGNTLAQQAWMDQADWDKAQLEWFRQYDGLTIYKCYEQYVADEGSVMRTVRNAIELLQGRFSEPVAADGT